MIDNYVVIHKHEEEKSFQRKYIYRKNYFEILFVIFMLRNYTFEGFVL